jgi:uroporphyrinogen decarboxylase
MGHKIFLDVLEKKTFDRIPFWFMRQAGRYLPEYRELRAKKNGFLDMAMNPESATEITLQPIRRFNMDAAIIFSDILVIPHALGQKLEFVEGEGPKLDALRSADDIAKLNYKDFEARLKPVYEAIANTRAALKSEGFTHTALVGFAGAPWTVACYMIEGGGSKDFINVKKMAYADPQGFKGLISLLVEATANYLMHQVAAGAEALQIFDSWAGVLDPDEYKRWVIQPTRDIVAQVRQSYPHIPIIGFPKGSGVNYQTYVQETGVTAIGIDSQVPTKWAARVLQPLVPVQGNLDPVCLLVGGDALMLAAERVISEMAQGPFVFNLGHGVHKDTPPEHVGMLAEYIRNHKA